MKEKHASVKNTQVYLQKVVDLMVAAVTVLINYCNNANKRTYAGFQRKVITFYSHKLEVFSNN
jgi:hypothetical protein